MILLGWEIGTGRRVEIPETGHLAWFGQTQLSGKTTALEAIAYRGELRAVAFITKQGEGGFLTGRMIPPYFSEPTNDEEQPLWRWVKSILEAGQQRRMNFEESWIIRACEDPRQATTLAEVHANIKSLLVGQKTEVMRGRKRSTDKWLRKPVTGINAGVYTSLKAYFDIVMPQLARLPYTKRLELHDGLNVMDLREYAMETQALVIRSVMEWVYQHEKGVRVIVPEAQDFVPQGKNSPVKMACETLVRKAGANKNFMWLDSQDMAAVDKIMLRACSIVGIGVQTEGHEIERSLAGLFTPQLKPVDIARLKIGEFFVRTPEAKVSKVYVQPAWMESELHAQAIAKGEERVESARQMLRAFKDSRKSIIVDDGCRTPGKTTPLELLHGAPHAGREYPPHQLKQILSQELPDVEESESLPPVDAQSAARDQGADRTDRPGDTDGHVGADADSGAVRGFSDRPSQEEEEKARKYGLGDFTLQPGDGAIYMENGRLKESLVGGDGVVRHFDHDTGLPWDQIDKQEPGKHETQTTQPGDTRIAGSPERTESASENSPLHEAVPGTSVRSERGANAPGSEGAMPEIKTSFDWLTDALRGKESIHSPRFLEELRTFMREHKILIEAHDALAVRVRNLEGQLVSDEQFEDRLRHPVPDFTPPRYTGVDYPHPDDPPTNGGHGLRFTVPDLDYIYGYVKARAVADPSYIVEVLAHRPEIRVKVERQVIHANGNTLDGRVALLVHEGFFDKPKTRVDVGNELRRRGVIEKNANLKVLSPRLSSLAEKGFLTIEGDAYKSVQEMKAQIAKA
jgi:hypothetical protein